MIHQAFVAVDEEGTEAAAATAAIMKFTSAVVHDYTFRADRPFIFLIQDDETGSILFMGRMLNPCAGASMCSEGDVPGPTPTPGPTPIPPPGARLELAENVTAYSSVIDGQSDSTLYKLSFDVQLRDRYRPIDLTPPYVSGGTCADDSPGQLEAPCLVPQIAPDAGSTTLITFTDRDQYAPNVPWTVDFLDDTSDDFILEGEERATITVWLMRQKVSTADGGQSFTVVGWEPDVNGARGILAKGGFPLGVNEQFTIEVQPLRTVVLMFHRTLPGRFEPVIDLR